MSAIASTDHETDALAGQRIDLAIEGMTCASCASRIERRLNKLDGVTATVNYATGHANVTFPEGIEPAQLVAEVEAAGYNAHLPSTTTTSDAGQAGEEADVVHSSARSSPGQSWPGRSTAIDDLPR